MLFKTKSVVSCSFFSQFKRLQEIVDHSDALSYEIRSVSGERGSDLSTSYESIPKITQKPLLEAGGGGRQLCYFSSYGRFKFFFIKTEPTARVFKTIRHFRIIYYLFLSYFVVLSNSVPTQLNQKSTGNLMQFLLSKTIIFESNSRGTLNDDAFKGVLLGKYRRYKNKTFEIYQELFIGAINTNNNCSKYDII